MVLWLCGLTRPWSLLALVPGPRSETCVREGIFALLDFWLCRLARCRSSLALVPGPRLETLDREGNFGVFVIWLQDLQFSVSRRSHIRDFPQEPHLRFPAGAAIAISRRSCMRSSLKWPVQFPRFVREIANAAPAAPAGVRIPIRDFWVFGFLLLTSPAP